MRIPAEIQVRTLPLPSESQLGPARRRFVVGRGLFLMTLLAGLGAAAWAGSRWLDYRRRFVVSHDAVVSATISEVGARIDGQIAELPIFEGRRIHKGDLIARLADGSLRARVDERAVECERALRIVESERVAIEQERRRLTAEIDRRAIEVTAAEASLDVASSTLPRLEKEFARLTKLEHENAATTSELDAVESRRDSALALVEERRVLVEGARSRAEEAQIALDGLCAREAALKVLEADVDVARAGVKRANEDLAATVVLAPADGWVAQTFAGPGSSVRVGQPIASLWIDDRVWIDTWVDEADLKEIAIGAKASITLPACAGRAIEGRVESLLARPPEVSLERAAAASSSPLLATRAKVLLRVTFEVGDVGDVGSTSSMAPLTIVPGLSAVVAIPRRSTSTSARSDGAMAASGKER